MKMSSIALLAGGLLLNSAAFADVSYQETTQITGGSMVGMLKLAGAFSSQAKQLSAPITSAVYIHGNRMLRSNVHNSEIIDLDQQTMTTIDHDKRTYSVVTFQQIQDQMAKAAASMKNGQQPTSSNGNQMTFSAHISSTGATRVIDGQTAKESLITITMLGSDPNAPSTKAGMAATSEMWLVEDAPGLAEMRRFNERMAKELSFDTAASGINSMLAAQPGGAQAMAELKKEAGKVAGFPVLQTTRVGMSVDGQPLAAPSTQPLPPSQAKSGAGSGVAQEVATETATQTATQTADNQIAKLGTFGRALSGSSMGALMRHTPKNAPSQAPAAAGTTDPSTAGILLENQTQTSGFSEGPVDTANFQIPSGYKQVTSPMEHK